jgi:dTDP-4-dehydrorhamnose reductase
MSALKGRALLTGAGGGVGRELQRALAPRYDVLALGREQLDISRVDLLRETIRRVRPAVIVNAAAYTAVDRAEREPALAYAVNAVAPRIMAEEAAALGSVLIHYSTDYVFDGLKKGAYLEIDATSPLGVYGRSKCEGEQGVQSAGCTYLLLRTSWVYGCSGKSFLHTMLRRAHRDAAVRVVADQHGAPTWSRLVADVTAMMLAVVGERAASYSGIYHLANAGETTWHAFAERIIMRGAVLGLCPRVPVLAIRTEDYEGIAPRPANSVLEQEKLARAFGIRLPPWDTALEWCLHEMATAHDISPTQARGHRIAGC